MSDDANFDLVDILGELSEVPSRAPNRTDALTTIAQLCRSALRCQLCTITSVSMDKKQLYQEACAGLDGGPDEHSVTRRLLGEFPEGGGFLDVDLIPKGKFVERYGLEDDGKGVADPTAGRKYSLTRMMAQPLWIDGLLHGYLSVFSSGSPHFTEREKRLLEIFGNETVIVLGQLRHQSSENLLHMLNEVCRGLSSLPPDNHCGASQMAFASFSMFQLASFGNTTMKMTGSG